MSKHKKSLISAELMRQVQKSLKPDTSRAIAFDPSKNLRFTINKGLRKPGRVAFEVLRRASYSVHVARICVNVLKEKVSKTEWLIKPIDPMAKADDPKLQAKIKKAEELFKHPNHNNETFRTFLDKLLEDILVLDAGTVEKTRYPDGELAELHYVDAATIRPVMNEYGQQDIDIPLTTKDGPKMLPVSYVQVMDNSQYGGPESGEIVAAWPKKDFLYIMMHPQGAMDKVGYGMSPLEGVLSVVANLLNADNYNGTYFEDGSIPPVILQMIGNTNQRDLEAMREYLYQELAGNWHRPAIMSGKQEMKAIGLKEFTNEDMEFMKYMTMMAKLLAAAYGLSGQDIGITDDLNHATADVQKDLSEAKGYGSLLHLLKEVFNQEIIWKDFGYTDLEFDWVMPDSTDQKEAMDIYDMALKNGGMTLNEVREKMGLKPYGEWADTPMILTGEGYVSAIKGANSDESDTTDNEKTPSIEEDEIKMGDKNTKESKTKEPSEVGGEKPYKEQEGSKTVKKSVLTFDNYKTWMDDRGYSQPFIYLDLLTDMGMVIKPPVAVNLMSQKLEVDISNELRALGLNIPLVSKVTFNQVMEMLPNPSITQQFLNYINMTPEYDSEKWRAKFGGSRKYPTYLCQELVNGRSLKDPLLIDDMKRDPSSYLSAINDLANLWKTEKNLVLGDRRADQYIITSDKRAWGIDYQFKGDIKRWEDNKDSIQNVLKQCPTLLKYFNSLTIENPVTKAIKKAMSKIGLK